MRYVLLLFILMPIIEIAVLLRVGASIGWLSTLAVVVLTAIIGTVTLRHQGLATLTKAQQRLGAGEMPAEQLLEGVLLMIGGVLLLTPGFVTDAFGFLCLLPVSRQAIVRFMKSRSVVGLAGTANVHQPMGGRAGVDPEANVGAQANARSSSKSGSSEVIDGDYHRLD